MSRLTVKERILLHLLDYVRYEETYEVPPAVTQQGIADATDINTRHFPQYARPLIEQDALSERSAGVVLRGGVHPDPGGLGHVVVEEGGSNGLGEWAETDGWGSLGCLRIRVSSEVALSSPCS